MPLFLYDKLYLLIYSILFDRKDKRNKQLLGNHLLRQKQLVIQCLLFILFTSVFVFFLVLIDIYIYIQKTSDLSKH